MPVPVCFNISSECDDEIFGEIELVGVDTEDHEMALLLIRIDRTALLNKPVAISTSLSRTYKTAIDYVFVGEVTELFNPSQSDDYYIFSVTCCIDDKPNILRQLLNKMAIELGTLINKLITDDLLIESEINSFRF